AHTGNPLVSSKYSLENDRGVDLMIPFMLALILVCSSGQEPAKDKQHDHGAMNARGEHAMGFSQTATTHHFFLKPDGGVIQVEVNDPKDLTNRDNIRMHLGHIAKMFGDGDFDIPMFVHDTVPPGVPDMKRLQKQIHYSYAETPNGGRVVITS